MPPSVGFERESRRYLGYGGIDGGNDMTDEDSTVFTPTAWQPAPGDLIRVSMPDGEGNRTECMYRVDPDGKTASAIPAEPVDKIDIEGPLGFLLDPRLEPFPREFRAKLGKLKPGSLTADGAIIDHRGIETERGPCFVPFDALSPARKGLMGEAGWHMERRPGKWPEIPPSRRHACIVRILP